MNSPFKLWPGVAVLHGSQADFNGGSASHNGRSGFLIGEGHLTTDSTDVSRNAENGIVINDGSVVITSNMTVRDNTSFGIMAFRVSDLVLSGSTITGNGSAGVRISETSHGQISSAVIAGNPGTNKFVQCRKVEPLADEAPDMEHRDRDSRRKMHDLRDVHEN
jgi:hypothetical protein